MDLAERGLSREVASPRDGDASIDRGGELQEHEGTPALQARHEPRVEALGVCFENALFDLDPRGAQTANPSSVRARIGVAHRNDDARDPGLADRVDAWWRPA